MAFSDARPVPFNRAPGVSDRTEWHYPFASFVFASFVFASFACA